MSAEDLVPDEDFEALNADAADDDEDAVETPEGSYETDDDLDADVSADGSSLGRMLISLQRMRARHSVPVAWPGGMAGQKSPSLQTAIRTAECVIAGCRSDSRTRRLRLWRARSATG